MVADWLTQEPKRQIFGSACYYKKSLKINLKRWAIWFRLEVVLAVILENISSVRIAVKRKNELWIMIRWQNQRHCVKENTGRCWKILRSKTFASFRFTNSN